MEEISFRTFYEDREGNLWLGTNGQGLYRVRKQAITTYSKPQGLVDRNVYPIYQDRAGAIWIGAWQSGLSRLRDGSFTNYTVRDGLASGLVTALYEDRAGRLWVGAHHDHNGGLRILKLGQDGRFTTVGNQSGQGGQILPDRTLVSAIHEDRAGALWFGTTRGLARYQAGVSTIYTEKDGLAGDDVRVIIEDAAGQLWIGAYGGLTRLKDGQFTGWTERDGLPSNNVRALYQDREGVLWIGTYDGGLGRFKDGRFTRYTTRDGLFNNGVFQILEDARGRFWISSNRGIYRVRKEELNEFAAGQRREITSIAYGRSDGMLNVECNGGLQPAGIKARDGRLWFPTQDGAAVIDPEAMPANPQPPPVIIESFLLDNAPVVFDREVRIQPNQENFEIQYTALSFINAENLRFKYKLEGLDHDWIDAGTRRTAYYPHVPPGDYTFRVIAANSDGVWNNEGKSLRVVVLPPFYRTWWFLSLAALGVGAAVWLSFRSRVAQLRREHAAREAFSRQMLDAQENFSRRLIESQEAERKRIAAELHDGLGQNLIVIKSWAALGLTQLDPDALVREQFDEISATAVQSLNDVREIIYNLRPYQLDSIGLSNTIKFMLEQLAAASGISFMIEVAPLDKVFSPEAEVIFYRVVQECANNIVKHSRATEATVLIEREARAVHVTIEDNGRGFSIADCGLRIAD
ncbi:MAG: ligand-binding sensor domain-containing protein, partial [Tepidisphaeraceae bacterium]